MLDQWAAKHGVSQAALIELVTLFKTDLTVEGGSESRVQSEIRLAAASENNSLWRNNAGGFTDETGRAVRYGLGNDSAKLWKHWRSGDLAGITQVRVQPHHVGRTFGVFTMIEVKEPGWNPKVLQRASNERERAQMACLTNVAALGGIAGFATSVQDYKSYMERWQK